MLDLISIFKHALSDLWEDVWTTAVVSFAWLICMLLVLPAPFATFGLFYYTNRRAHDELADHKDFWFGVRAYWPVALRWGLVNLFVLLVLVMDYRLTGLGGSSPAVRFAQGLYVTLTVFWILLQFYALPFLFEQETPSLRSAWRNAAVMIGKHPLYTLAFGLLLAVLLLLGTVLFLVSVPTGGCLIGNAANRAVLNRLQFSSQIGA
jgi:hypothetical protein